MIHKTPSSLSGSLSRLEIRKYLGMTYKKAVPPEVIDAFIKIRNETPARPEVENMPPRRLVETSVFVGNLDNVIPEEQQQADEEVVQGRAFLNNLPDREIAGLAKVMTSTCEEMVNNLAKLEILLLRFAVKVEPPLGSVFIFV